MCYKVTYSQFLLITKGNTRNSKINTYCCFTLNDYCTQRNFLKVLHCYNIKSLRWNKSDWKLVTVYFCGNVYDGSLAGIKGIDGNSLNCFIINSLIFIYTTSDFKPFKYIIHMHSSSLFCEQEWMSDS